jgi:methylated-DNA-[protein]-cysteine S-methyltransferase
MNKINIGYYKKYGFDLVIGSFKGKLCLLDHKYRKQRTSVDNRIKKGLKAEFVEFEDGIILEAKKQLDEYFEGIRKEFDIPLLFVGSDFQKSVWNSLLEIPYGETRSYKQQAKMIQNEKAIRAVASANGANAIAIIVPCHRIIGSDGKLTGYAGGLGSKNMLLKLENNLFSL